MKELSLNVLDIAGNSVKAGAELIEITLTETEDTLLIHIGDNGCGMRPEFLAKVTDPFTTTRTTRPVGLGLPFLKMEAEMTGGWMRISSVSEEIDPVHKGTTVEALFHTDHIDCLPLGDITATVVTLIQGSPGIDFDYRHTFPGGEASVDTRELRAILGDISPAEAEILVWIRGYLLEQYAEAGRTLSLLQQ